MAAGPLLLTTSAIEQSKTDTTQDKKSAKTEGVVIADLGSPRGALFLRKTQSPPRTSSDDDLSSSDSSSISSASSSMRRVSFCEELISDVWERPKTPKEDCEFLFYQQSDYQTFRQDYRRALIQAVNRAKKQQHKEDSYYVITYWAGWVSQVVSAVKQEGINMSKALSQPPADTNVFVDTMYLY